MFNGHTSTHAKLQMLIALICIYWVPNLHCQQPTSLFDLPIENLLDVEVTLLKNSGQEWHRTPAAVHVVHASDARASGYLSVMESLREVPGMHVSQVSARTWAISARFYNSVYANKQQVLVDGVEAYSPVFSGVH